ncbi:hypothetical protein AURDEDRAFT_116270 [Auricularia subglabra TFB-10046 SS5]|uniref:Uncharacterized protein n=1 Tax=Auricularia subglabra (strain TFB-10046 / SS5) TaxID=717982 RepID=J0D157_AURST|nr:hypothetical protein AURDEDRAFT_116270 [Auricularia subglabra TFB-10046 SS5]
MNRHQKTSLASVDRHSVRVGKRGRMRPCLVLRNDNVGNTEVILLSTLGDGYHPSTFCCNAQHFLIPLNKTPAWPAPDCFRIDILPDWPNGTRSYVLGLRFHTDSPHYGQWERLGSSPEEPRVPYRVDLQKVGKILFHCSSLEDASLSWAPHQKALFNATYKTHNDLRRKIQQLEFEHSPADLKQVTHLYNQHTRAVAIATGKRWVESSDIPLQVIPVESRAFFARKQLLSHTTPFHAVYPARTGPVEQAQQMRQIEDFIRGLSFQPKGANESDFDDLAEILYAIIAVASKPVASDAMSVASKTSFVHPSFSDADLELLTAVIKADQTLARELREVRFGYFSRASTVLNYVCQTPSPN